MICDLNDSEWNTDVHFLLGENAQASEEANKRLRKSIQTREKFSLITNEQVLETIIDKKNKPTGEKLSCILIDYCPSSFVWSPFLWSGSFVWSVFRLSKKYTKDARQYIGIVMELRKAGSQGLLI